jgi:hypothetical protein
MLMARERISLTSTLNDSGIPAVDVVRLDREHFLQRVRGAVRLERPHFHFAEALTAELRLAPQRLLRDQAVRPGGSRMHLVVDQMVELEHVHVPDRHRPLELLTRAPVVQRGLTRGRQIRECQEPLDLLLARTVEHGGRHRHTVAEVPGEFDDFRIAQGLDVLLLAARLGP